MPLKVNFLVVVQVKKEDLGSLLDDAVKQGTKPKIEGKAEKENSEEVDDPTPTSKQYSTLCHYQSLVSSKKTPPL